MLNHKLRIEVASFVGEQFGGTLHRIAGRSMWPILRQGMLVQVEPLVGDAVPGDILVYRTAGTLIAHRMLALQGTTAYRICGDAVPATLEEIARADIIGRVTHVWPTGKPTDLQLSSSRLRLWGRLMVWTHPVRAMIAKLLHLIEAFVSGGSVQAGNFQRLVEATLALRGGDRTRVKEILIQASPAAQLRCIGRHAMGGILSQAWSDSSASQDEISNVFGHELRKTRILTNLSLRPILTRVDDLLKRLNSAQIPYILLKGAARFAAEALDADRHHSTDVDVLIPRADIDRAERLLLAAGYVSRLNDEKKRSYYLHFEHHRPPLWMPNERVPIELHTEIARPGTVSQHYDFSALRDHAVEVHGPLGPVWVLNPLGSALHLAYHALQLQPWRDVVILADLLKNMTPSERSQFDSLILAERKNAIRLQSVIVAADALNGYWTQRPGTTKYLNWVMEREELPLVLKHRSGILEGVYAKTGVEFTGSHGMHVKLIRWGLNLLAVPLILLWCARNSRRQMLRRWTLIGGYTEPNKFSPNP